MKTRSAKKPIFLRTALTLAMALLLVLGMAPAWGGDAYGASGKKSVTIVYTADMHSKVQPVKWADKDGNVRTGGGFARVDTVLEQARKDGKCLTVDAGGFAAGSPYATLYDTDAAELMLMAQMGYDVVNLGPEEWSLGADSLSGMLTSAAKQGGKAPETKTVYNEKTFLYEQVTTPGYDLPQLVAGSVTPKGDLRSGFDKYGVQDYTIIRKGGVKIAVIGLMADALDKDRDSCVTEDPVKRAKALVEEIRRNGEADMIVCLYHGSDKGDAMEEAKAIANGVDGIHVIVAGHGAASEEAVTENGTVIVSCGSDTRYVGRLTVDLKDGKASVAKNELIGTGKGEVTPDEEIKAAADAYDARMDKAYFSKYGFSCDKKLAETSGTLTEGLLGDLTADSYVYYTKQAEGDKYVKVDVALVSAGFLEDPLYSGSIRTSDAFMAVGAGTGADGTMGVPLVNFYLKGKDIKKLAEIDATLSAKDPEKLLYFSGLSFSKNDLRVKYNRAYDIALTPSGAKAAKAYAGEAGPEYKAIDDDAYYRVVTDLYTYGVLKDAEEETDGALGLTPRTKKGKRVTNIEKRIVSGGKQEVKAWQALAAYTDSFKDDKVPAVYLTEQGRKAEHNGINPVTWFKQPNKYAILLWVVVAVPVILLVVLILLLRRRRNRRRGYARSMFGKAAPRRMGGKPTFERDRRISKKIWK